MVFTSEFQSKEIAPLQKTIHSLRLLLPLLAGTALIACDSSKISPTGTSGTEDLSVQLNATDNEPAGNNRAAGNSSTDRTVVVVPADDPTAAGSIDPAADASSPDQGVADGADVGLAADSADDHELDDADQSAETGDAQSPPDSGSVATADDEVNTVAVDDDSADSDAADQREDDADGTSDADGTDAAPDDSTDATEISDDDSTEATDTASDSGTESDSDTDATDTAPDSGTDTTDTAPDSGTDTTDTSDDNNADSADVTDDHNTPGVIEPMQDEPQPTLPIDGFASGTSGIVLDCANELPCTASNADGAIVVAVENVYRHPQSRRLAVAVSVTTSRDTTLRWDNDTTSSDNLAMTYYGTDREFRSFFQHDRGSDVVTLLAGTTMSMVQHFRDRPLDAAVSIAYFDTGYTEAGARTTMRFSNLPLDPVLGDIVDCNFQMPCTWVSKDESYSVNAVKASGLWQTGRLRIDYEVGAVFGLDLHVYGYDSVVGNDGSVFTPRTHSLNGTSDYREFTESLVGAGVQRGYQDFRVNAERLATSLVQVKLGLSRVDAPAAGSPVFKNMPLE